MYNFRQLFYSSLRRIQKISCVIKLMHKVRWRKEVISEKKNNHEVVTNLVAKTQDQKSTPQFFLTHTHFSGLIVTG